MNTKKPAATPKIAANQVSFEAQRLRRLEWRLIDPNLPRRKRLLHTVGILCEGTDDQLKRAAGVTKDAIGHAFILALQLDAQLVAAGAALRELAGHATSAESENIKRPKLFAVYLKDIDADEATNLLVFENPDNSTKEELAQRLVDWYEGQVTSFQARAEQYTKIQDWLESEGKTIDEISDDDLRFVCARVNMLFGITWSESQKQGYMDRTRGAIKRRDERAMEACEVEESVTSGKVSKLGEDRSAVVKKPQKRRK
jgi:hypothetical protein